MSKPWFPFYVGDFLADTMNFSVTQKGAYVNILCHYWTTQEPMTRDEMMAVSGLSKNLFEKSWHLFAKKFVMENEKYFNRRMRREIIKAIDISEKRSAAATKSHAASAGTIAHASATQSQSQLHKDKKRGQKKPRKKRAAQLPDNWILPDDYREYCITKRPDLDPDATAENFRDYYLSHGKPMVDWKRTWQRWVRNEHGTNRKAGNGTGRQAVQTPADRNAEAARRYFGEGDGTTLAAND